MACRFPGNDSWRYECQKKAMSGGKDFWRGNLCDPLKTRQGCIRDIASVARLQSWNYDWEIEFERNEVKFCT